MTDDALSAFQIAVNDQALWRGAQDDPGELLWERGLRVPDAVDVAFVDSPRNDRWPAGAASEFVARSVPRRPILIQR